jgi:hypothetical protein
MQTATAFLPCKVLLSGVELDLFTTLGKGAMTASQLQETLELHPQGTYDFFDALVSMKFLEREGDGPEGRYKNTPETAAFLDMKSPIYIGGILEMFNGRLYGFWNDLSTGLKTGEPQNETKINGHSFYDEVYADKNRLREFLSGMDGLQIANFHALAEAFDFSKYQSVSDIGGALGTFSVIVGERHPHLDLTTFDLPAVAPLAQEQIDATGMSDRITVRSGDFFAEDLPQADVLVMSIILHNWNLERKKVLIEKAYEALPEGGAFIVIEFLIDDARRENTFSLLDSLNMLIEFGDGFSFTGADFQKWCREAGFKRFEFIPLDGPASAGIAYK